jgi:hypothetical protein
MKSKTIRLAIRNKIDSWLASIEDEEVRELAAKNTIVTGGAIASMFLKEQVNDWDIYFRNWETTYRVAKYYVDRFTPGSNKGIPCRIFLADENKIEIVGHEHPTKRIRLVVKSAGIATEKQVDKPYEYFESRPDDEAAQFVGAVMTDAGEIEDTYEQTEQMSLATDDDGKPKYRPVFMSTNAITLSGKIQIVIRFFGKPEEIHENYDFQHCTNFWTSWDDKLELKAEALEALLTKELRYVGSKYPICSLIRLRKFLGRGWTVNAGQILKMVMQVSSLDLTDMNVLEDQLTGVDAAYFSQLLSKLREQDPDKVDAAYLVAIVDKMF